MFRIVRAAALVWLACLVGAYAAATARPAETVEVPSPSYAPVSTDSDVL
ncbi:hypothetical protein [Rhodococcus tibetensis]|uniref:Uncharacterized protein n=1 Tax=Rhodococcus tibetensis TaxID=2965064 RepID=A0ABT1QDJ6_9NOCA|nr:hypothetical protein [Rhodococcus sp. FXJ9.536]MCQ4120326.1 hypothetical protein [Rhodococcus sp. FXJ9.536]